jgi:hypothetical protein
MEENMKMKCVILSGSDGIPFSSPNPPGCSGQIRPSRFRVSDC